MHQMKIVLRLTVLIICTLGFKTFAFNSNIDVYGTSENKSNEIIKTFGKEIQEYSQYFLPEKRDMLVRQSKDREAIKQKIIKKIKRKYNFSYVEISPIFYGNGEVFSTVDVIEKKDVKRLVYLNNFNYIQFNSHIDIPDGVKKLMAHWDAYMEEVESLFLKKELLC